MLTCPINLNPRRPWSIMATVVAAVVIAVLLADPAILFLAPLAIPAMIWHRTRRNWLAADRSMRNLLGPDRGGTDAASTGGHRWLSNGAHPGRRLPGKSAAKFLLFATGRNFDDNSTRADGP